MPVARPRKRRGESINHERAERLGVSGVSGVSGAEKIIGFAEINLPSADERVVRSRAAAAVAGTRHLRAGRGDVLAVFLARGSVKIE